MNRKRNAPVFHILVLLILLLSTWVGALTPVSVQAQTPTCVTSRISASADDAEEKISSSSSSGQDAVGGVDLNGETSGGHLQFYRNYGVGGNSLNWWGMRFLNINVPQGATITSASITFRADATSGTTASGMTLWGQLAVNPDTFTATTNNITNRTRTTASVAWSVPAWTSGTNYATPALTGIVQEIVNQAGWTANNAMVVVGQATVASQNRTAISRDSTNGATLAPLLEVCYTTSTAPTILTNGTLNAFTAQPGVPSAAQTYTVAGSNLTADIDINAPAGFEISKDGSGYGTSLALAQSGGTVATTTIYVRLYSATEGTPSGNISHTSAGATARNVAVSGTVSNCTSVSLIAMADAYMSGYNETNNYGASDPIKTTLSTSTPRGTLFKWDVSSIPANATVTSASLKLNVTTAAAATFNLYNLRRAWVEGTGTGSATGDGATWLTYNGSATWGTDGAANTSTDRYDTNLWGAGSTTFNSTGSKTVSLNTEGVSVVQGWISSATPNYGLTIQNYGSSSTTYDLQVNSNNNATAANRPTLIVAYCATTGPSISTAGALSAFASTVNVASTEQSYTVSGQSLTGDIVVTAPADFLVSRTSGSGFATSVSLTPAAGTVAPTTIYVRFLRTTVGVSSGDISHTSTGATPRTVAVSGTATNGAPSVSLLLPADNATGVALPPTLQATVSDPESEAMTVSFYGRAVGGASGEDFTIAVVPDSQNESTSYPTVLTNQFTWLASQFTGGTVDFVTSVGDIVNTSSSATEYGRADGAYDLLDAANAPYTVSPGNHDLGGLFNTYFGPSRFAGKSYYQGPLTAGANENSYSFFSFSGMDFIVINLTYSPGTTVLDWADALLKANTGRRGIVVQHDILNVNNSFTNQASYDALRDNPNLFLMLCGHMHSASDGSAYYAGTNTADGKPIHIVQTDYQDYTNGGNGYVRFLRFSPADDKIYATISNASGASLTSSSNYEQFAMDYSMDASSPFELIQTVSGVASGTSPSISWPGRAPTTEYEWYATASDGASTTTSPTWSFTTGAAGPTCYALTLSHTGQGSDPVATPTNSAGCATGQYVSGATISLSGAVPTAGWQISGWTGTTNNASTAATNSVTMPAADQSAGVSYTLMTFTLMASAGPNGSISPLGAVVVNYGADQAFTITPDANYHVADVLVDGVSVGAVTSYTFNDVAANHTIAANFALNTFTLKYTAGAGGSLTGNTNQTVAYGASGTAVIAVPNAGYSFVKWSDDSTANPRTDINVMAHVDVTANFALIPVYHTLSVAVSPSGGGSTAPAAGDHSYLEGSVVDVTATPAAGYSFSGWSGACTDTGACQITMSADKTVTANFTLIPPGALSLTNVSGFQNAKVTVPVTLSDVQGLLAVSFRVAFDPAVVQIDDVLPGTLTTGWQLDFNEPATGQLSVALSGLVAASGSGTVAEIHLTLIGAPGTSSALDLQNSLLNDGQIPAVEVDGQATIFPNLSVAGAVHYWQGTSAVPGVLLTLDGNTDFTDVSDASGAFVVENAPPGAYTLKPAYSGEARNISAYDAALVLQHVVGRITLADNAAIAANVNRDGIVGALDASYILQKAVDLISLPFPDADRVWDFTPASYAYASLASSMTGQDFTAILLGDPSGNWADPVVNASSQPRATITFVPAPTEQDGTNTVTVWLSPGERKTVWSLEFDLRYEDGAFGVLEPVAADGWLIARNVATPGVLRVAAANAQSVTTPTLVMTLRFKPLANTGSPVFTIASAVVDEGAATGVIEKNRILLPIVQGPQ